MCRSVIIFFLFFSLSLFGQKTQQELLNNLENSFSLLSKKDVKYKLTYQKEKEILYLKEIKHNSGFTSYKLLINDIHPLGVFLDEKNKYYSLKVLSKNNGNVFIKETRSLSTINYLELGKWSENYKEKLKIFINDLKQFIDFKTNKNTLKTDGDNFKIITKNKN